MTNKRIAAASTDGIHVDAHFGKAERFLIYDVGDKISWIEDRFSKPLSVGDPSHSFDPEKFNRIASLLKDCDQVYVSKIGEIPAAKLKAIGIEPVIFKGLIGDIR